MSVHSMCHKKKKFLLFKKGNNMCKKIVFLTVCGKHVNNTNTND